MIDDVNFDWDHSAKVLAITNYDEQCHSTTTMTGSAPLASSSSSTNATTAAQDKAEIEREKEEWAFVGCGGGARRILSNLKGKEKLA